MEPAEEPDGMPMLSVRFSVLPAQSTMGTWAAWQQSFGVAPLLPAALQTLQNLSCALEAWGYVGEELCHMRTFHVYYIAPSFQLSDFIDCIIRIYALSHTFTNIPRCYAPLTIGRSEAFVWVGSYGGGSVLAAYSVCPVWHMPKIWHGNGVQI